MAMTLFLAVGCGLGLLVGRLSTGWRIWLLLALVMLAPVLLFTAVMLVTPPASHGTFLSWWVAGMIMGAPALLLWVVLVGPGLGIGRHMAVAHRNAEAP